ncbi:MAG: hypothetical protein ACLQG3_16195 [Terracidiphilus sp.]
MLRIVRWMAALVCFSAAAAMAQSTANVNNVNGNYVWDAVKAVLAERHLNIDVFNEQTNRLVTVYSEYTAHFMRYRTKFAFELDGTTLVVSLDSKQQQLSSGWGNPQIPSKGADDKMVQDLAQAVGTAYARIAANAPQPAASGAPVGQSATQVVRDGIQYDLLGCYREELKVKCKVALTNVTASDINYQFDWHGGFIIDSSGVKHPPVGSSLGKQPYGPVLMLSGVSVPYEATFDNIGVEVTQLARLQLFGSAKYAGDLAAQFATIPIGDSDPAASAPVAASAPAATAPVAPAAAPGKVLRGGVAYEFQRCLREGDRVDCRLTATNTTSDDINLLFDWHTPYAIDDAGVKISPAAAYFGKVPGGVILLVSGVPTPIRLVFGQVSADVKRFARIQLCGDTRDHGNPTAQFSNLPIANADEGAPANTVFRGGVRFSLVGCTRAASTVTCSWKLNNQLQSDAKVALRGDLTYVLDSDGTRIGVDKIMASGVEAGEAELSPGADVPVTATFQGIGSSVSTLVRVVLGGGDGWDFTARSNNVPITAAAAPKPAVKPAPKPVRH